MDRRQDPRTIVTPYAFSVHPDLLGLPLATPMQRLGAIGIDLVVVFGLTRIGGTALAVASGLFLLWLALRKPTKDAFGKGFRAFTGCLGLLILGMTIAIVGVVKLARDPEMRDQFLSAAAEVANWVGIDLNLTGSGVPENIQLGDFFRLIPGFLDLQSAEDERAARSIAQEMARAARDSDMPLQEIRSSLTAIMPDDAPWSDQAQDIVDDVMADLRRGASDPTSAGSEDAPDVVTPVISDSIALDSIAGLNELVATLDEELHDVEENLTRAQEDLDEARNGGPLGWLLGLIDDLGLGFGWAALYLTLTHAWWKGLSVGKKILGIRVVMIDKRPLNWWLSFERAGGYAAGLATGLLGFAQVFWDPNRQAIHDKVAETVVIQDGKKAVPGPWVAEGRAQWEKGRASREGPNPG